MALRRVLFSFFSLLMAQTAMASYLRISPTYQTRIDIHRKTLTIQWVVKNDGDEPAESVGLELPAFNESYLLSAELAPQQQAAQSLTLPFSKLGIEKRGIYSLVYRVTYKDANLYPFSAPHLAQVALPPGIGRVLAMQLSRSGNELQLPPQSNATIGIKLLNISEKTLLIEGIESLSPVEIPMRTKDVQAPFQLAAGEEKKIPVTLMPSQPLVGSVYVLGLVVSGTVEDTHFSEPMTFVLRIRDSYWSPRNILLGLMLGISAGYLLAYIVKKYVRKQPNTPRVNARPTSKRE